jgi:N-acetylmuramoyl-L-alanine amidase
MIRTTNNVNISNKERALKANEESDIYIRLHADASGSSSVSGATALCPSSSNRYISKLSPACKKLSKCVIDAMCKKSGTKNRGLSARDDLTGTNWSKIPVTLIEMGFMTNPAEDRKMQDSDHQILLAEGMADGIDEYFN